jgi:hypothetical protein
MTHEKAAEPRLRRRLRGLFGDRSDGASEPSALHTNLDARLTVVETALRHLEAALEGLQDAIHRRSQLDDQRNDELLRRTGRDDRSSEGGGRLP